MRKQKEREEQLNMNERVEFEKLMDVFSREICFYRACGFVLGQIARILYEKGEICYWERKLLEKGETLWMKQD